MEVRVKTRLVIQRQLCSVVIQVCYQMLLTSVITPPWVSHVFIVYHNTVGKKLDQELCMYSWFFWQRNCHDINEMLFTLFAPLKPRTLYNLSSVVLLFFVRLRKLAFTFVCCH